MTRDASPPPSTRIDSREPVSRTDTAVHTYYSPIFAFLFWEPYTSSSCCRHSDIHHAVLRMLLAVNRRRCPQQYRRDASSRSHASNVYGSGRLPRRPPHAACSTLISCCPPHSGSQMVNLVGSGNRPFRQLGGATKCLRGSQGGKASAARSHCAGVRTPVTRPEPALMIYMLKVVTDSTPGMNFDTLHDVEYCQA